MLTVALLFGMLWPSIAPLTIAPGMTREQVEAILGEKPNSTFITGGGSGSVSCYRFSKLAVYYDGGQVKVVQR